MADSVAVLLAALATAYEDPNEEVMDAAVMVFLDFMKAYDTLRSSK